MKFVLAILLTLPPTSRVFAATRTILCQGSSIQGASLTVSEGGWFSSGKVLVADRLPTEFEWRGKEPSTKLSDLKAAIDSLNSKNVVGSENLDSISSPLRVLVSSINLGQISTSAILYIEEGLLTGTQSSGIFALITVGRAADIPDETNILIAKCR